MYYLLPGAVAFFQYLILILKCVIDYYHVIVKIALYCHILTTFFVTPMTLQWQASKQTMDAR